MYILAYIERLLSACQLCRQFLSFKELLPVLFYFLASVTELIQEIASNNDLYGVTRAVNEKQKVILLNQVWINWIDKHIPEWNYFPITFWLVCGCLQFIIFFLKEFGFVSGSLPYNCLCRSSAVLRSQKKSPFVPIDDISKVGSKVEGNEMKQKILLGFWSRTLVLV